MKIKGMGGKYRVGALDNVRAGVFIAAGVGILVAATAGYVVWAKRAPELHRTSARAGASSTLQACTGEGATSTDPRCIQLAEATPVAAGEAGEASTSDLGLDQLDGSPASDAPGAADAALKSPGDAPAETGPDATPAQEGHHAPPQPADDAGGAPGGGAGKSADGVERRALRALTNRLEDLVSEVMALRAQLDAVAGEQRKLGQTLAAQQKILSRIERAQHTRARTARHARSKPSAGKKATASLPRVADWRIVGMTDSTALIKAVSDGRLVKVRAGDRVGQMSIKRIDAAGARVITSLGEIR